jgi:hypothetical protein
VKKLKLFSEFCTLKSYKNNCTTKPKEGTNTVIYAPAVKGQSFNLAHRYIKVSGSKKVFFKLYLPCGHMFSICKMQMPHINDQTCKNTLYFYTKN